MKRSIAFFSIAAAILLAAPQFANAGHWEHQWRLQRDTDQLHHATHVLHELIHHRAGFSHLDEEAHALDEAAAHFAETAALGGNLAHLRADFDETARELRHVQTLINRACHVRYDWRVQQTWAAVERAFDRVYYDLYSNHCGFVTYGCQIGGGHIDDHGHGHGGHGQVQPLPQPRPFPINNGRHNGQQIGGTIKLGPVTIQTKKVFSNNSSAWNNHFKSGFNR
ncbi:hypothetical protein [Blastopirellula marina]|uniref:Uncharacterized protein n=1 Tax=Blastopirellula marina TaxID=124 RepID=A0A2S8GG73_9BACT|nr:hypothetical protein [Blastopirellula marina]PQO43271.1 hypothetical protein C5Y93_26625 [Blastopirellula marina]